MFFDAHAHIDGKEFDEDRQAVLQRARDAGVTHIVCIGAADGMDANYTTLELAKAEADVYATVGVHPHDAKIVDDACLQEIEKLAAHDKVVALGESGLDYHYDHSPRDKQQDTFRQFLALSRKLNLPLVVHTREADEDTIEIIESADADDVPGVLHSFTGTEALAKAAVARGWMVSFSGILTFRNAQRLRDIAQALPPESVMVETDSPFLTPVPHRGKRNEPAFVTHTADQLAQLWQMDPAEVRRITGENAARFYRIDG